MAYPDDFDTFSKPAASTVRASGVGISPAALVSALADRVEKLERKLGLAPSIEFTVNDATDTCSSTAHGMTEGAAFTVKSIGGLLPVPLVEDVVYYGQSVNPDDFQITDVQFSGVPIDLLDAGTGTLTLTPYFDGGNGSKILMGLTSPNDNMSRWSNNVDLNQGTLLLPLVSAADPRDITGDIVLDTGTDIIKYNVGSSVVKTVVDTDTAQTLDQKTLTAPTITDFTNATHDHTDADDGGLIPVNALDPSQSPWLDWSPTLTNLSGGTLTFAKYQQIGTTVHFRFRYVLGGAGVSGVPRITLPVTALSDYATNNAINATGQYNDANGSRWLPRVLMATTGAIDLFYQNTSAVIANLSSTVPFTWASTDVIEINGTYEAAV